MVAESRAVGLNHTAGLSTPQQVQMTLLALDALLDRSHARKKLMRSIVKTRFERLFKGVGVTAPSDPHNTCYYATIDIPALARSRYGASFAEWLAARCEPTDFVVRLAAERGIVALDGGGFDAPNMSVRVSLANLPDEACEAVGRGIRELLADYHERWRNELAAR
jgi:aspartate 4-decarboxylase